eukprot:SAG11_NODE_237_length_11835_cov_11.023347_12_plen_56_part_00
MTRDEEGKEQLHAYPFNIVPIDNLSDDHNFSLFKILSATNNFQYRSIFLLSAKNA